jgi:hypothetical protein
MLGRCAVALAIVGCGRVGFDSAPVPPGGDGGPSSGDGDGSAAAGLPPIGGLSDNFDSPTLASFWSAYADAPSQYQLASGQLQLTLASDVSGAYVGVVTNGTYDVREHAATLEAIQPTTANNCGCYFQLEGPSNNVGLVENSGVLQARIDNTTFVSMPYDPVQHRWWQLSEHAGTTTWSVSPDGVTWNVFATAATTSFESAVDINLGGGTQALVGSPGSCVYDNFDLPP